MHAQLNMNTDMAKFYETPSKRSALPSQLMEEKKEKRKDLSDLLDTHQDRPTEIRRRDQVKIITTPWTETQTL